MPNQARAFPVYPSPPKKIKKKFKVHLAKKQDERMKVG